MNLKSKRIVVLISVVLVLLFIGYVYDQYKLVNKNRTLSRWSISLDSQYDLIHYESTAIGWPGDGTILTIYALDFTGYLNFKNSIQNHEHTKMASFNEFKKDIQFHIEFFNNNAKESFKLPKDLSNPDKFTWWYLSHNQNKLFCLYDIETQQLIVIEGIY